VFHAITALGVVRLTITIVALVAITTPGLDLLIGISQISSGIGLRLLGFAVDRVVDCAKALLAPKNNQVVMRKL